MAVVRPYQPNFAEMAVYKPLLAHYDVTYYYTGPDEKTCRKEFERLDLSGIRIRRYRSYTDALSLRQLQRLMDFKVGLGSLMLSCRDEVLQHEIINLVDPIYAHAWQIVPRLSSRQKLVYVIWENIAGRYQKIALARRHFARCLSRGNGFLCTSDASLHVLQLCTGHPLAPGSLIDRIYPGIFIPPPVDRPNMGMPKILFVGRPQWSKGLDHLLAAFAILLHQFRICAELRLVGINRVSILDKITDLRIEHHVTAQGRLTNAEVREEMRHATLFCLPSLVTPNWTEQFGFAMVEAMSFGLPVVANDSGCIREICGDAGIYASTGNAYRLAECIANVLKRPNEAPFIGRRLRERALAEFDAEKQGHRFHAALQRICGTREPGAPL